MTVSLPIIGIIVPCYLEEEILEKSNRELTGLLKRMEAEGIVSSKSFLLYVDDCSGDTTWNKIKAMASPNVKGIRLSPHRGQQYALLAGLEYASPYCDACITIDADLQDDIEAIPVMVKEFIGGAEIVYGVREDRHSDRLFKRSTAKYFYGCMKRLGVDCIPDHADFRLMSSEAVRTLLEYRERNLFLRGLVPKLGFRESKVFYARKERQGGKSKYNFRKMTEFAVDGITSFSVTPVRLLFWIGMIFMIAALAIGIYTLIRYFTGETIEGWASLILSIWFCTGILLMGMGVMGEYIGKIYIEVKNRPRYRISDEV